MLLLILYITIVVTLYFPESFKGCTTIGPGPSYLMKDHAPDINVENDV